MSAVKNVVEFDVKVGDKTVRLMAKRPTNKQKRDAKVVYAKAFQEALTKKLMFRRKLEDYMKEQGFITPEKVAQIVELQERIAESEVKLKKGGAAGLTKADARKLALQMKEDRNRLSALQIDKIVLDRNTAEGHADNAEFSYLVSVCTYTADKGDPFFKSYEDYMDREEDEASYKAAEQLAYLTRDMDPEFEKGLPENKFLLKYGFVNDKLRLVNKDGKLVDEYDRLVDEEGRLVDETGSLIDYTGIKLNKDGDLDIEFTPFLDEVAPAGEVVSQESEPPSLPNLGDEASV